MSRLIRTFSLPPEVCDRVDRLVETARYNLDLAQKLGLLPSAVSVAQIDSRGLIPEDYEVLRKLSGLKTDGDVLIEQIMRDSTLRTTCIGVVGKAQRRNYKLRDAQTDTTSAVNVSRVVAAVLLKGLNSIQAPAPIEKKASENAAIKSASRTRRNAGKAA